MGVPVDKVCSEVLAAWLHSEKQIKLKERSTNQETLVCHQFSYI